MSVDDRRLGELIVESRDLQVDALRDARAVLPDLREIGEERRRIPVDQDRVRTLNASRRTALRTGGLGIGALAARGLLAGTFGTAVVSILGRPVAAQSEADLDVQILQTASSLEILAVATYEAALGLPFIADGNPVVKTFAETTMGQHDEHRSAFQDQTTALGGTVQDQPNSRYQQVVTDATPGLTDPAAVVQLAMALEEVATDTYLADIKLLSDGELRRLMGSVMGVEAQHLSTLRAVDALLAADPALIALPPDLAALPDAAGSVAFPENGFEDPDMASPPEEGAVA
jgi:hypothetical protein